MTHKNLNSPTITQEIKPVFKSHPIIKTQDNR